MLFWQLVLVILTVFMQQQPFDTQPPPACIILASCCGTRRKLRSAGLLQLTPHPCSGRKRCLLNAQRVGERQLNEQFSRPQPRSRPVQRVTQADLAAPRVVRRPAVPEGLEALEPQELKRGSNNGASG